jgi:hypothetical protein
MRGPWFDDTIHAVICHLSTYSPVVESIPALVRFKWLDYRKNRPSHASYLAISYSNNAQNNFYLWVLHPVAPSIQLVPYDAVDRNKVSIRQLAFIFILSHYKFRPLRAIFRLDIQLLQHVTSLHQIAYVQRMRCIRNSPLKYPIVYLT